MSKFRFERDSMGEVRVPQKALYGAQTQRAVNNFKLSGITFGRRFIEALGLIKQIAAKVNGELGLIPEGTSDAVQEAAREVRKGKWDRHFPLDIYQTGSGTSTNMNANEVIARRGMDLAVLSIPEEIHPNDHVNFGQSSNDVIPTAIRVSAYISCQKDLVPALEKLRNTVLEKGKEYSQVVKTGRTHLMDAMPVSFEQVFSSYLRQLDLDVHRIYDVLERIAELPMGGTAVGTGINTHPQFAGNFAMAIAEETGYPFVEARNHFEAQATVDSPVELSGVMKTIAVGLLKIVNDLRWMNSGPNNGLGEIRLPALQPGSSIMPGKTNPVIEESVAMVCAQVIGYDAAISIGGLSGTFELNTMLPLVAHNLLEQIRLLAGSCRHLEEKSVSKLTVNVERVKGLLERNPILATVLNPLIGYDKAAEVAKKAFAENRSIREVAEEMTGISKKELDRIFNPMRMTWGGLL
ncbi:class II fumarate hydratase [Fibrobacterota bacterium]